MQTDVFSCLYVTVWVGSHVSCKHKSKIRLSIFGYSRGIFLAFLIFITINNQFFFGGAEGSQLGPSPENENLKS